MSRPSRGFSVAHATTSANPLCPSAGTTTIENPLDADWTVDFTWLPLILVGTLSIQTRVNGGAWSFLAAQSNVNSGTTQDLTPRDFGDPGDLLEIRAEATDVGGCPDFLCDLAGAIIT